MKFKSEWGFRVYSWKGVLVKLPGIHQQVTGLMKVRMMIRPGMVRGPATRHL